MGLGHHCKLVLGVLLFLLTPLSVFSSVAPPADYAGDYWSSTANYTLPGQIVELESMEAMYISLQGPPGFANVGYSPDLNPNYWATVGPEAVTPEPGTLLLIGSGILALWAHRKWLQRDRNLPPIDIAVKALLERRVV